MTAETAWPQGLGKMIDWRSKRQGLQSSRREHPVPGREHDSSLNRCGSCLPNSIPARGVKQATNRGLTHDRLKP